MTLVSDTKKCSRLTTFQSVHIFDDNFVGIKCKKTKVYFCGSLIRHEEFKTTLFDTQMKPTTCTSIRSFNHELFTVEMSKMSLSPIEDKWWLFPNGIQSRALIKNLLVRSVIKYYFLFFKEEKDFLFNRNNSPCLRKPWLKLKKRPTPSN